MQLKTKKQKRPHCFLALIGLVVYFCSSMMRASSLTVEPIHACIIPNQLARNIYDEAHIAACLDWVAVKNQGLCGGYYKVNQPSTITDEEEIHIQAGTVSLSQEDVSILKDKVSVRQTNRIIEAETAYLYRDPKTKKINKIELKGIVRYQEPEHYMVARKAVMNPQDKSGVIDDVIYRFFTNRYHAMLPAIGQAKRVERFPNEDYLLEQASYSTCPPMHQAWHLTAKKIKIDKAKGKGVARDATLYLGKWPVVYTPYFSFPTSKERKTGFLMPMGGYSTAGGVDLTLPFYWNMAPNYDATLIPHYYSRRGLMTEGEFRYLSPTTSGLFYGTFLPHDKAFQNFIQNNAYVYPQLTTLATNRYALRWQHAAALAPNLSLGVNFEQVSDDYYFHDFSNNLSLLTQRQLLKEGVLTYTLHNWLFRAMVQGYQTLNPVNETFVSDIYQRLPQLLAQAHYDDLPFHATFDFLGQYDQYDWPGFRPILPEGPRFYANPILAVPLERPWGYLTPSFQLVQRNYEVSSALHWQQRRFGSSIPRFGVDAGLVFERNIALAHHPIVQTLEPRLFYLNVPYQNQTAIPVYDSAYMIFNTGQLFRSNRFSGFDRIGDTNQLTYGLTSRFIAEETGDEIASLTVGQIRYFANRKTFLCQSATGYCEENPLTLGFLSPTAKSSPVAASLLYHLNEAWVATGDYAWDPATSSTNNGNVNIHFQPTENRTFSLGYTYLVNGDITQVARHSWLQTSPLHQVSVGFAWPLTERISTLGAYGYNISKKYAMASYLGLQYDDCCWAARLMVGRNFKSLDGDARPQYVTGVYFQILLKGLGLFENKSPNELLSTYIPGYAPPF